MGSSGSVVFLFQRLSVVFFLHQVLLTHSYLASDDTWLESKGNLTTLTNTSLIVYAIQEDWFIPGNLIFADGFSLKTTSGITTHLCAGSALNSGYTEGIGAAARFSRIGGILHLSHDKTVVVDSLNNCLRTVDRSTNQTSVYIGNCTIKYQFKDGHNPLFWHPFGLIRDVKSQRSLLTVSSIKWRLRRINIDNKTAQTLIHSISLAGSRDLIQNKTSGDVYIAARYSILRYDYHCGFLTVISGSTNGFSDGPLGQALYARLGGIAILSDHLLITSDSYNERLRILDLSTNYTWSICNGTYGFEDGSLSSCQLDNPKALFVSEGSIYIGQAKWIRVIQNSSLVSRELTSHTSSPISQSLESSSKICPNKPLSTSEPPLILLPGNAATPSYRTLVITIAVVVVTGLLNA